MSFHRLHHTTTPHVTDIRTDTSHEALHDFHSRCPHRNPDTKRNRLVTTPIISSISDPLSRMTKPSYIQVSQVMSGQVWGHMPEQSVAASTLRRFIISPNKRDNEFLFFYFFEKSISRLMLEIYKFRLHHRDQRCRFITHAKFQPISH